MANPWRSSINRPALGVALVAWWGVTACDRLPAGRRYDVGHGVAVWHRPPETGGFLPWQFEVVTPADHVARAVVLERGGVGRPVTTVLEAPLPATSGRSPVTVTFDSGHVVLRVAGAQRVGAPETARLRGGLTMNPWDLPQDASGALVLQYSFPERLARDPPPTFAEARRIGGSEFLRLRIVPRPTP